MHTAYNTAPDELMIDSANDSMLAPFLFAISRRVDCFDRRDTRTSLQNCKRITPLSSDQPHSHHRSLLT
jgi:hypothetical protein